MDEGQAGDQLGALLRGVKKDDIRRGMVLCKPGTLSSHKKVKAQVRERERKRHCRTIDKPLFTGLHS